MAARLGSRDGVATVGTELFSLPLPPSLLSPLHLAHRFSSSEHVSKCHPTRQGREALEENFTMRKYNTYNATRDIDPQAAKWLANAINPFPDESTEAVGFPSTTSTRTLPQTVTLTTTITSPTPSSNNPWECAVSFLPFSPDVNNASSPLAACTIGSSGSVSFVGSVPSLYPGLNVLTGPAGMDWGKTTTAGLVTNDSTLAIPPAYATGQWRLVGAGYEIVNTTSAMYKQGSITTARTPCGYVPSRLSYISQAPPGTGPQVTPVMSATLPPTNCVSLSKFPGAITREASSGSYAIIAFNRLDNPMIKPCLAGYAIGPMDAPSTIAGQGYLNWATVSTSSVQPLPFDITTSHLCGLSEQTSLTITVHYYIERVPGPSEVTLQTLTKPSTPFDPNVLEVYSRAINDLPFDVPQGENPLGEWFNSVVKVVRAVAPAAAGGLGTLLLGPAAGAAAYKTAQSITSAIPIAETQASTRNKADDNSKSGVIRATATARNDREIATLRREIKSMRGRKPSQARPRPKAKGSGTALGPRRRPAWSK